MAVAKGRAFLVYIGTADAVVTGTTIITDLANWKLVGGAQERSITISNEAIDGTHAPATLTTPLWAVNLSGAKSVAIEVAARFVNEQAERELLNQVMTESAHVKVLFRWPDDDTPSGAPAAVATEPYGMQLKGEFLITSMAMTGGLSDTFNWSLSLVSNGEVKIVNAA